MLSFSLVIFFVFEATTGLTTQPSILTTGQRNVVLETTAATASNQFSVPSIQATDDCNGSGISALVDPLFYFAVTPDCTLLASPNPFNLFDLTRKSNAMSTTYAPACLHQPPIVFKWSASELALIRYDQTGSLLIRYSMESGDIEGEIDVKNISTSEIRTPERPTTCHKRSAHNSSEIDTFVCYSFVSASSPSIQMTTFGYDNEQSLYRKIFSSNISLPHFVNVRADKLMGYEDGATTKVWMQSRLNWLYNLDTVDFQTRRRTRLTTYLLEEPLSQTHLLFSDNVGLTTAVCAAHNKTCTYRFHRINKKSALTSSCLLKYDYLIRMGVIAIPKQNQMHVDAITESSGPIVLDPLALKQPNDADEKSDAGEYAPLDPDYGAYNVMAALCIIVFVYLLLYFGLLLYPEPRSEIAYMQATYTGLEELVDELGLNWTQFKADDLTGVVDNLDLLERALRQKTPVPTQRAHQRRPQKSAEQPNKRKSSKFPLKKADQLPTTLKNKSNESASLQRPNNIKDPIPKSCATQATPSEEQSGQYQPPVSSKKKTKRTQSSLPTLPEEFEQDGEYIPDDNAHKYGVKELEKSTSASHKNKTLDGRQRQNDVNPVRSSIGKLSPPISGSSKHSAQLPRSNPVDERLVSSSASRRIKNKESTPSLNNGAANHSPEMPEYKPQSADPVLNKMTDMPEGVESQYAQEYVRKGGSNEVNLATTNRTDMANRMNAGRRSMERDDKKKHRRRTKEGEKVAAASVPKKKKKKSRR